MSKHDEKLEQKSPAKTEISGALDDKDIEKVSGGDSKVAPQHEQVPSHGLGLRKSSGNTGGGLF